MQMSTVRLPPTPALGVGLAMLVTLAVVSTATAQSCPAPVKGNGIVLNTPNGCESYRVGDTMRITWDMDSAQVGQMIRFSPNNGRTEVTIGRVDGALPNYMHGPFLWAIPDTAVGSIGQHPAATISDSCRIHIYDYSNPSVSDVGDRVFSIGRRADRVISAAHSPGAMTPRRARHSRFIGAVLAPGEAAAIAVYAPSGRLLLTGVADASGRTALQLPATCAGVCYVRLSGITGRLVRSVILPK